MCIVVYDVTDQESFNNVKQWLQEIETGADLTITCETFNDEATENENEQDVIEQTPAWATFRLKQNLYSNQKVFPQKITKA